MKQKRSFIFIMLFLSILGLSGCSSNHKTLDGKYVSIYNETSYLIFNKDGSFTNSLWNDINNGTSTTTNNFIYTVDDYNVITAVDTTIYEGEKSLKEYEVGILYNNYICIIWNGLLPKTYEDTTITNTLGDLLLTYNFKEDKSYEYTVTSSNEIVNTENGTYTVNDNEVICTKEDGVVTTFISEEDKVFCIEYVKE